MHPPPLNNRKALLSWTKKLLDEYMVKPRKRYSQNFVVNPRVINDILSHIDPSLSIMEIGTGLGTLSYYLSRRVRKPSLFVEIDPLLAEISSKYINKPHILIAGDALELDWHIEQIISNTPYHLTSEILVKIARSNSVKKAILVLQKDVVDRLIAKPGTRDYGRLTILMNTLFELIPGSVYDPSSFYPSPEVSSQLILLVRKKPYSDDTVYLEELTRRLFNRRRRKVYSVLHEEFNIDEKLLVEHGINPEKRVYQLTIGDLERLMVLLRKRV